MAERFSRILIFFDLPTETRQDRRVYTRFRKLLIKNGFLMMQESVYCKLVLHATAEQSVLSLLRRNRPPSGVVEILTITERQYSQIEYLVGEYQGDIIQTGERLIVL